MRITMKINIFLSLLIISCITCVNTFYAFNIYLCNAYGKTITYRMHPTMKGFDLPFYSTVKVGYTDENGYLPPEWDLEIKGIGKYSSLKKYIYDATGVWPRPADYDLTIFVNKTDPRRPFEWNISWIWEENID